MQDINQCFIYQPGVSKLWVEAKYTLGILLSWFLSKWAGASMDNQLAMDEILLKMENLVTKAFDPKKRQLSECVGWLIHVSMAVTTMETLSNLWSNYKGKFKGL